MFTGVDFEKAIDYYRKGKEVIVLDRNSCGSNGQTGYDAFPFQDLFENLDFLVDVPAVPNPEFEQAVQEMIENTQSPDQITTTEQETQEEPSAEEVLPPPHDAGDRRNGSSGRDERSSSVADEETGKDH